MTSSEQPHIPDLPLELQADDLSFCTIPGYTPEDFNYKCPNTDLACGAKLSLISQYTRDIDESSIRRGDAEEDAWKLDAKLLEYTLWARGVTCTEVGRCMVRKAMDESVARQAAVSGFRKARNWLKKI